MDRSRSEVYLACDLRPVNLISLWKSPLPPAKVGLDNNTHLVVGGVSQFSTAYQFSVAAVKFTTKFVPENNTDFLPYSPVGQMSGTGLTG